MRTAIARPQRCDRAVRLVALDDEPALRRRRRCRRAAGSRRRSGRPGRARAVRGRRRSSPLVVVLPCAPATTIESPQRDELGEQLRARLAPRRVPGERGRDVRPPSRRAAAAARPRSRRRSRSSRVEVRRRRAIPAARPPRPTRARGARTRSCPAPPIPTIQSRRPSSGQGRSAPRRSRRRRPGARAARIAARHLVEPRRVVEQRADELGHAARARSPARRRRRRRARSSARSSSGGRRSRTGTGTSTAGFPAAASSQTEPPARASARSAAPSAAPKSSVNGKQAVVGSRHARAQLVVVALAGEVEHRRARSRRSASIASSFSAARPGCRRTRAAPARLRAARSGAAPRLAADWPRARRESAGR